MITDPKVRYDLQQENKQINQKRMWRLRQQPCTDCGLKWHPRVMTFDHLDRKGMKYHASGKPVKLNELTYWQPKVFNMQLKQMEVVCMNCHRIREDKRDMNNPMVKPNMKEHFEEWFKKCKGALVKGQIDDL
jgi:hypothetical protein